MRKYLAFFLLSSGAWALNPTNLVTIDFDKETINGTTNEPVFYKVNTGGVQYREVVDNVLKVLSYSPCPNGFDCVTCDVAYNSNSPSNACLDGGDQEGHTFDSSLTSVSNFPNLYYYGDDPDGKAFFSVGDSALTKDRSELYVHSTIANEQIYRLDFSLQLPQDNNNTGVFFPNYDPDTPNLGEYNSSSNREWFMIMQARQTGPTDGSPVLSLNLVRDQDSNKFLEVVARSREAFYTTTDKSVEHRTCGDDEQDGTTPVYNNEGDLVSLANDNLYYWVGGIYKNCPETKRKTLIKWNIQHLIGNWKNIRLEYRLGANAYVGLYVDFYGNEHYRLVGEIGDYKNQYGNDIWKRQKRSSTATPNLGYVFPLPTDWIGTNKMYLGNDTRNDHHVLKLGIYRGSGQFRNGIPRENYNIGLDNIELSTMNP